MKRIQQEPGESQGPGRGGGAGTPSARGVVEGLETPPRRKNPARAKGGQEKARARACWGGWNPLRAGRVGGAGDPSGPLRAKRIQQEPRSQEKPGRAGWAGTHSARGVVGGLETPARRKKKLTC